MGTTSNYALRLPASLKKAAEKTASADGTMLNQFIISAVAEKLSSLKTAEYFATRTKRADVEKFGTLMNRTGGGPPWPGDEVPEGYKRGKMQ